MNTTDPIADLLTCIRNGQSASHDVVAVPASKMKIAIAHILKEPVEGFAGPPGLLTTPKILRDFYCGDIARRQMRGAKGMDRVRQIEVGHKGARRAVNTHARQGPVLT